MPVEIWYSFYVLHYVVIVSNCPVNMHPLAQQLAEMFHGLCALIRYACSHCLFGTFISKVQYSF